MQPQDTRAYPLPISRALEAASGEGNSHSQVMLLADTITCYIGAVAVGQYSQALFTEEIESDPTLTRSLRSLRRVTPGQWLLWSAKGLGAAPQGRVEGMATWYYGRADGPTAEAYGKVLQVMVEKLGYTGEYGPRADVSPRLLLEIVNQYSIIRSKRLEGRAGFEDDTDDAEVASVLLTGLQSGLSAGSFLKKYDLYAPQQKQLLMGSEPTRPMPPISSPTDTNATLLLYPPGEVPDYTKRPNLQSERSPLFPLDPLLVYERCGACDLHRVAALREVFGGTALYRGLDPECRHDLRVGEPVGAAAGDAQQ
ncbi:MAG TPA: hypothetical protein VM409_07810 [Chloroflexia bacterium]|nr:hypothetical protein [Chloroflexia bacterium]